MFLRYTALICLIVFTTTTSGEEVVRFSLDDVLGGDFLPEEFNGTWISDTEFTYRSSQGAINIFNVETSEIEEVVPAQKAIELRILLYTFSPDRNFILFVFDHKFLYRYSSLARYSVLDLASGKIHPVQPDDGCSRGKSSQALLRFAMWNRKGNDLFYVCDNNIFYRPTPDSRDDIQVTITGLEDTIFNGATDWVYEEEILYSDKAIWTSPGGKRAVFASFNDSLVDVFQYSIYGDPGNQYPTTQSIRYPKPGRTNPTVSLWSIDVGRISTNSAVRSWRIPVPVQLRNQDYYFSSVVWANEVEVSIFWLNRHQNISFQTICNVVEQTCEKGLTRSEPHGWVDMKFAPKFSQDGRQFLAVMPVSQGEKGDFKHLVHYNRDTETVWPLTSGTFEVTQLLAWNEAQNLAFVIGTAEGKSGVRHLYQVGTTFHKSFNCLTCQSLNGNGKDCAYNSAKFSVDHSYYVHGCEGPDLPRVSVVKTETGREVLAITENVNLQRRLSRRLMPRTFKMQLPVGDDYLAPAQIFIPPALERNPAAKFPLVVNVYGGPGFQLVTEKFGVDYGTYLATAHDVVYALIDGRGSGYQGNKFMHEIHRRLGTVEVDDQISVTKFIAESLPFIDETKVALWGHSYGGFVAASALVRDTENVFKCAVSVAPVTDWLLYDSVYTERYMGLPTPEDNEIGYKSSSLVDDSKMSHFMGKKFYLVHGTADDNVHYQQSMMLAKTLEAADVLFRQQSYTDENHSIFGLRKHHYHSMTAFLMGDCFGTENEIWG